MEKIWTKEINGRELSLETGRLARQANGSILAKYGDTTILVTATMSEPREGVDFLPLMVNYEERVYAIGKIPGSVTRREGRPRDRATLFARLIDRPLRPLFPEGFRHDIQVIATVLSVDDDCDPEMVAMNGASAALTISDIPFAGPIAGVKVGLVDDELVINPSEEDCEESRLDLMVAGSKDAVLMVEAGADQVSEEIMLDAIELAHEKIKELVELQEEMRAEIGLEKMEYTPEELPQDKKQLVRDKCYDSMQQAVFVKEKLAREEAMDRVKDEVLSELEAELSEDEFAELAGLLKKEIDSVSKDIIRTEIIENNRRPDGRKTDEIRDIQVRFLQYQECTVPDSLLEEKPRL